MREADTAQGMRSADSYVVVQNSVVLFIRYLALWGLNSVLVLFIPRYLGDQGLGQLQFALSFVSLFTIALALGVRHYLIKEVARNHAQVDAYLGSAIGLRLLMVVVVLPVIMLITSLTGQSGSAKWVIYIAALWMVFTSFAQLLAAVLNGLENMSWPSLAETVGKVVVVAAGIPVLVFGHGVLVYSGVLVAGAAVHLAFNAWYISRRFSLRLDFRLPRIKALLVGGAPFLLMGAILNVYQHIDVVMLRALDTEAVVGWYAAAMQIFRSVEFLSIVLTTALLPTLARMHSTGAVALASMAKRGISVVLLFTIPLAFGLSFLSRDLITLLPYPDVFLNSAPLLSILALSIPVTALLTIMGIIAIAVDRQKQWAIALLFTASLNVGTNAVGIPYFREAYQNGAIGAALATLVSESFMILVGLWLMPKGVIGRSIAVTLLKVGVASGAMVLVAFLVRQLGMGNLQMMIYAAIVYGALIMATRAVLFSDLRFICEATLQRLRAGKSAGVHKGEVV